MGLSSSLLDENKFNFIKGWTQTELRNFASFYKKQYSLAFLSHVHDELVQRKQEHTQLLKQRDPPQEAEVIYQESVLYFYDNRKWKERFLVVRANYSLECHESYETFMKGILPPDKLPTTGGTILTTEEKYMEVVDRCFPDTDNVKEDFAPPVVGMPGQFPVYLRLPYQRDHYFCFLQEAKQAKFISVLSDCIRHQNQDFLKKKTYEVQAFAKAVQLYRQDKGYYEPWDMLIGNDVQVLANLTMEELLPSLEKDLLPRLKAKKMERKRMWFATIEATYNLVQETLMEDMAALNDECRETTKQQSALMRSDMDQIMSSQAFLESKLRATVADLATEYCKQHIEPHLRAVLEEMMGPISLGFEEAREVSESMMEYLCQKYQEGMTREELQQALVEISKPNLESCYEKVSGLRDHIQEFNYPNCRGLEHSTQIDIQQLVDSVAYTYGLLLSKSPQDSTNLLDAMVKARNRVLKQYDYDSSTQRKKIFQEALLSITLPSVKAFLAPTFKKELPNFEQYIFDDYVNFINVENVYEDILQQILETDISKVVKEAASMKKYNLFMESRYRFSVSSMYVTPPGSPDYTSTLTKACNALPSSPLLSHGLMESQSTGEDPIVAKKKSEPEVIMAQQEEVQAQPELTNVPTGENTFVAEKMVEQEVIMAQQGDVQARTQPDLIKVPAGEDTVMAEKMVEPEVIVAQKVEVQAHTQLDLLKEPTGEDTVMGEKIVEQEEIMAQQVQLPAQAQPELTKVPTGEDPVMAEKMVEPEVIVAQQVEVQAHAQPELIARGNEVLEVPANAATEVRDRSTTPETLTVHTAGVEEMLVATQSLEESTYSGPPNVVAINTETLVDPSSSSNTEPTLKSAALTLAEPIPKPVETEANETPVQASPPEGDTGSMDQVSKSETSSSLKFVSAESETESAANIRISSAEETVPGVPSSSGVQPLVVEEQNSNTTGDTKVVVDDLTSLGAPIYEIRASNMAQDFSDDSSWTTEEEGDSIEEDDLTTETTSAIPEPEDSVIVKCETISDVSMNVNNNSADPSTEAARPLDCIKEIRALVVEVIEVEEVAQHCPDSGDVSLNTQ